MFQSIVERLLNSVLGEYLENFNSENLKIGIWSGEVVIRNVRFRAEVIRKLNLPLVLLHSRIGCLRMNIPWKNLTGSKIEVLLDGLQLLVGEVSEKQWLCKDIQIIEKRSKQLTEYCEALLASLAGAANNKAKDEQGYFSKLVVKIIDNLQIIVKDIHVRYEDRLTNRGYSYSFGVTLEQLSIKTVNKEGHEQYIDRSLPEFVNEPLRKKLQLHNIGLYWNDSNECFIGEDWCKRMEESIARRGQSTTTKMNYIVLISSSASLLQRQSGKQFIQPQIDLAVTFAKQRIQLTNRQLQQIITLGQRLQRYKDEVRVQNMVQLSASTMESNRETFIKLLPVFIGKKLSGKELEAFEGILETTEEEQFYPIVKKYLQTREKQRIIKQKSDKSRGWFSGPKAITEADIAEVEKYLQDNFGDAVIKIPRPAGYSYLVVRVALQTLEIVVANEFISQKQGLFVALQQMSLVCNVRDDGYALVFKMKDIKVDLLRQLRNHQEQHVEVLRQMNQIIKEEEYVRLIVEGNPISKPYLATDISLETRELLVIFDPRIINIITTFCKFQVSRKNTQQVLQKYGQFRQKTSQAINNTLASNVKKQVGLNICIRALTLVIFFDQRRETQDCWAMKLGLTMVADQNTLKQKIINEELPIDKFGLALKDVSLRHCRSLNEVIEGNISVEEDYVLKKLSLELCLQIFQNATPMRSKIRLSATIQQLGLSLTSFTYKNLLHLANSLAISDSVSDRQTVQVAQKSQVLRTAQKIDIVYRKEGITQQWKKYFAVLSHNYIYLFVDKKDPYYAEYYYIKHCKLRKIEGQCPDKIYQLRIQNKLNFVVFGFDKQNNVDDWYGILEKNNVKQGNVVIKEEQTIKSVVSVSKGSDKNYDDINMQLCAVIRSVKLTIFTSSTRQDELVSVDLQDISTRVQLFEGKIHIKVGLRTFDVTDNIYAYKCTRLQKFLYTTRKDQSDRLIDFSLLLMSRQNPQYDGVDTTAKLDFGILTCNYKCESIQKLLEFFVTPQSSVSNELSSHAMLTNEESNPLNQQHNSSIKQLQQAREIFLINLEVTLAEVSLNLINCKNKALFGKVSVGGFTLSLRQSNLRMALRGALDTLSFLDYSEYPHTVIEERVEYGEGNYLLKPKLDSKGMVRFDVELLKTVNNAGKDLLVKADVQGIEVYYVQQPVLRVLTYLTTQFMSSLSQSDIKKQAISKQQQAKLPPKQSTMQLHIQVNDSRVLLCPRDGKNQHLGMSIGNIFITNNNKRQPYLLKGGQVLVEQYLINIKALNIFVNYTSNGQLRNYKLTNDMDFTCCAELISNPLYYAAQYGNNFLNGLRVECSLSAFFIRLNHEEYNFVMKCVAWNVSYDDRAELILYDVPVKVGKDPIYFKLTLERVSMFVTEKQLPIIFVLLEQTFYELTMKEGMDMVLKISQIYGTTIEHVNGVSTEHGMFNAFGYECKHATEKFQHPNELISLFDSRRAQHSQIISKTPFLLFNLSLSPQNTLMHLAINHLDLNVDIRTLLIFSQLAILEPNIEPPTPTLPAIEAPPLIKTKSTIAIDVKVFTACISDSSKKRLMVVEGNLTTQMLLYAQKQEEEMVKLCKELDEKLSIPHTSITVKLSNFSIYFCSLKVGSKSNKRQIIRPFELNLQILKIYTNRQGIPLLMTRIGVDVQRILLEASLRDLIKINIILQDNFKLLGNSDSIDNQNEVKALTTDEQEKLKVEEIKNELKQFVKQRTQVNALIRPVQIVIVNDCGNTFMPIAKFIVQEFSPLFDSILMKSHLTVAIVLALHFFNPRSSKWQPILQSFGLTIDYLVLTTDKGNKTNIFIENSPIEQFSDLKINVSTQLIASLRGAYEVSKVQKELIEMEIQKQQIEVSPYILQNITNQTIIIHRSLRAGQEQTVQLPPLFRGPIRLSDDSEQLVFTIQGIKKRFGLQHYGYLRIPQTNYYLQFKAQTMNRVISFLSPLVHHNNLRCKVIYRRDSSQVVVDRNRMIPLDGVNSFQISLKGKQFTIPVDPVKIGAQLKAENGKFIIGLKKKITDGGPVIIQLEAPMLVHNCLPLPITMQFLVGGKTFMKEMPAQQSHEMFANQSLLKMEYRVTIVGFEWSNKFRLYGNKLGQEQLLELSDEDQRKTTIKYLFAIGENDQYYLTFYCKAYIMSEIAQKLAVYSGLQQQKQQKNAEKQGLIGGQKVNDAKFDTKIVLIDDRVGSWIRVCGVDQMIDFSSLIPIQNIGSSQSRITVGFTDDKGKRKSTFTSINVQIGIKQMIKDISIFSKQIKLSDSHIIINNTGKAFTIVEEGSLNYSFVVGPYQRRNMFFSMPETKYPRAVIVKTEDSLPSAPMDANSQGNIYFMLRPKNLEDNSEWNYKVNIQQIDSYLVHEIRQLTEAELPYSLQVRSAFLLAMTNKRERPVVKGDPLFFINDTQKGEHKLVIKLSHFLSPQTQQLRIVPDDFGYFKTIDFLVQEKIGVPRTISVSIRVVFSDNRRQILIEQSADIISSSQVAERQKGLIIIRLKSITLSLIQNHNSVDKPYQSFLFTLQSINLVQSTSNYHIDYQLRINFFQLDQCQPYTLALPVVVTTHKYKQFIKVENAKSIINLHVKFNCQFKENTMIEVIGLELEDIVVRVSEHFVNLLLRIINEFGQVMSQKQEDFLVKRKLEGWRQLVLQKEGKNTFVRSLMISPFVVQLSAELRLAKLDSQANLYFGTVLSALGVVISNIDSAPVSLSGLQLRDCIDSLQGINSKVVAHYKMAFLTQLYKLVGSLNIIGNPMSLFRNISKGVRDMTEKPLEGIVQGPLEFGIGLAQGAGSLMGHAIGGAFNSLSKMTGTISSGLAVLAFDDEFEQHRQRQKLRKPQHVIAGIGRGGKAIFYGLKQGITGVFLKPIQNAKKDGALGFMKGTAIGLAGLIIKPVTGLIDFASKTTQGIKSTALAFQDKPNEVRIRYPRVFYSQCYILRDYSAVDAKLNNILQHPKNKQRYIKVYMLQSFVLEENMVLLVSQQWIMQINVESGKIQWEMETGKVKVWEKGEKKLVIHGEKVDIDVLQIERVVEIEEKRTKEMIVELIGELQQEGGK